MIGAKEDSPIRQVVMHVVSKSEAGFRRHHASSFQVVQESIEADLAQHHYDLYVFYQRQLAIKIMRTVGDFRGRWLILRRSATNCGSDVSVGQTQPIAAMRRSWLRREARFVQHGIHEVSGTVAGERTTCAIGSMRSRRESQNQHSRIGITETRNRLGPVVPAQVGAAFLSSDLSAIRDEPRASRTRDDLLIELR